MIKKEYGYGYNPEYHKDIKNLKNIYLLNERNNLFIAKNEKEHIIGTIAIREYDKNFNELKNIYCKKSTASLWRLFVDKQYRRCGIASELVKKTEKFSRKKNYEKLYLHTHKNIKGALDFWQSLNYNITIDTNNKLKTVHMEKTIINNLKYDIKNHYSNKTCI
jgi:ribosomal protein S18 acetylase RimI-like enzyme